MASLYKVKTRWKIDVRVSGQSKRIHLGTNKVEAERIFRFVSELESGHKYGVPMSPVTVDWLRTISDRLRVRLAQIGLIQGFHAATLEQLTTQYLGTKPNEHSLHRRTVANLLAYFGESQLISEIRRPDCVKFRVWLSTDGKAPERGLSTATIARRIKCAREVFSLAIDREWISRNPFKGVEVGTQTNSDRSFYVTEDLAHKIIARLPDTESKLVFALGRFAGFRLPSESEDLRWSDINWKTGVMTFRVRKLAHNPRHRVRSCPIFKQLRPYLEAAYLEADDKAVFVCPRMNGWGKSANSMFTKQLRKSLAEMKVDPWERLLANLRASCSTDIRKRRGTKAESVWLGHSEQIALDHYDMVTDADWAAEI